MLAGSEGRVGEELRERTANFLLVDQRHSVDEAIATAAINTEKIDQ